MKDFQGRNMAIPAGSIERGRILDQPLAAADLDDVVRGEFPASPGFRFAVHFDFAALDHHLGVAARFRDRAEFQELIETQGPGLGSRIIARQNKTLSIQRPDQAACSASSGKISVSMRSAPTVGA
jgi:hypothetical protein